MVCQGKGGVGGGNECSGGLVFQENVKEKGRAVVAQL